MVTTEAFAYIGDIVFTGDDAHDSSFYLGLGAGAVPTDLATTLASGVTEVTGTNYARIEVADSEITKSTDGSYQKFTCAAKTFNSGRESDWDVATYAFLCTAASGTAGVLISLVELDGTYQAALPLVVTYADRIGPVS